MTKEKRPRCQTGLEIALYAVLVRITQYDTPDRLRRRARKEYGLEPDECVEMAYENVLGEAERAVKRVLPPRKRGIPVQIYPGAISKVEGF